MFTYSISNSERFLGRYKLIRWGDVSMWQKIPMPQASYPPDNPFYEGDIQLRIDRFDRPFSYAVFLEEDLCRLG